MKKFLVLVNVLFIVASLATSVGAQTKFVEYKKYLIPINIDKTPNVYYIDDVDDSRQTTIDADPNGVQELPIVVGWKNLGHYNLVGVGADGKDGVSFDASFTQKLLGFMQESTPVFTGRALRDSIIEKALALGSPSNRLVIAIGGPREIVLEAIVRSNSIGTPIQDLIRVIGIQACRSTPITNCPNPSVGRAIRAAVGTANYHIIVDSTTQAPSFRWFYLANSFFPHVGNRNAWYRTHFHQSKVGRYFRDSVSNGTTLDEEVRSITNGLPMKIADFTALAYLIWGEDIWSTEFETRMYTELEAGLATLPK